MEGTKNKHLGQGTSNRRFFRNDFTIELLYISNSDEAKNGAGKDLELLNRSIEPCLSPFGIVSRVTDLRFVPEFSSWQYFPDFFMELESTVFYYTALRQNVALLRS